MATMAKMIGGGGIRKSRTIDYNPHEVAEQIERDRRKYRGMVNALNEMSKDITHLKRLVALYKDYLRDYSLQGRNRTAPMRAQIINGFIETTKKIVGEGKYNCEGIRAVVDRDMKLTPSLEAHINHACLPVEIQLKQITGQEPKRALPDKSVSERFNLRLTPKMKVELTEKASEKGMALAEYIRSVLAEELEQGGGTP